jgi:hypothetical protein
MSQDNELTPEIEAALRDFPAADPALRDQHIAAALGELAPAATMKRRNLFAAAAAVLVLAGAGVALSQNSDGDTPAVAAPDTTITSVPKASSECPHTGGFWGDVGGIDYFTLRGAAFELVHRDDLVDLYFGSEPCTMLGTIGYYEAMQRRDNQEGLPTESTCSKDPLVQFTDNAGGSEYRLALLETSNGVSLFFEDRCNEPLGTVTLPPAAD